jgi:ATP-dependent exoDNAse (exonuclease V) beta subunit
MASLSPAVLYVARTRAGWHTWYVTYPNFGTAGFVEP